MTRRADQVLNTIPLASAHFGDVLLLSGRSALARLIRMIEGTTFDHVGMLAPPNYEDPAYGRGSGDDRTSEPWMFDVSFMGGRWIPLSAYEERLQAITVRRHPLLVQGRDAVVRKAQSIVQATRGYHWERMLYLTMVGATRWTHQLHLLEERHRTTILYSFFGMIAEVQRQHRVPIDGERRVCTELLMDSFDQRSGDGLSPHLGLYIPSVEHHGLLWWAAGIDTFAEFIASQPPPPPNFFGEEVQPLADLHEVTTSSGLSFPGSPEEPTEEQLRTVIIDAVTFAVSELCGGPVQLGMTALTDPRKLAWNLLDQIMRRRCVVTPGDIEATPTLLTVGALDLSALNLRK